MFLHLGSLASLLFQSSPLGFFSLLGRLSLLPDLELLRSHPSFFVKLPPLVLLAPFVLFRRSVF
ncbi:MAG: hypothetical protein ACKO7G_10965, partial [Gammaproteobacteria bacterium]